MTSLGLKAVRLPMAATKHFRLAQADADELLEPAL